MLLASRSDRDYSEMTALHSGHGAPVGPIGSPRAAVDGASPNPFEMPPSAITPVGFAATLPRHVAAQLRWAAEDVQGSCPMFPYQHGYRSCRCLWFVAVISVYGGELNGHRRLSEAVPLLRSIALLKCIEIDCQQSGCITVSKICGRKRLSLCCGSTA